ncbi:MAG: hypothetical protein ACOVNR_01595 [Chitinophagaceae bacterium]
MLLVTFYLFSSVIGYSQQNLFNIPSGDITDTKKGFYQHQLNVYSNKVESKAHFVYGLGKGWDAGVNLVGKGAYFTKDWRLLHNDNPTKGAVYPILMGTLQKQFNINKRFDINLGTQFGSNLSNKINSKVANYFLYGLGVYYFNKRKSRVVGGVYKTNEMFVGTGNTAGMMLGYEIKLAKRWYLMGDWVSGNNDASVAVLGGMYNLSKRVQLCAGWQVPNANTPKPQALVLEINILGWDAF